MKQIKFKHLSIADFQGISHFEMDFNTGTTRLLGTNSSGKSSVIDAIMWIITGKNQKDQSDSNFEIVPLDALGRMIPTAEPHGKLVVEVDGVERTIERKLKLKVPKTKNGEIDYSTRFKTDRTFWLDGLNYKATPFSKELVEIFGDNETYKTLSNVIHFGNNKSEKEQRALLLSYIKPVSHEMICEIDDNFKSLVELEKLEFSDVLEQTRARILENKKEIEGTKNRIDEVKLALFDFKDVDTSKFGEMEVERSKIQGELTNLKDTLEKQNKSLSEKNKLNSDLLSIEFDIKNFNTKFQNQKDMDVESKKRKILNKEAEIKSCGTKYDNFVKEFNTLNTKITNAQTEVDEIIVNKTEELKAENLRKINSETKYFDGYINRYKESIVEKRNEVVEDTCNSCEQALPLEGVEKVKINIANDITKFEEQILALGKEKERKLLQINDDYKKAVEELNASKESMVASRAAGYRVETNQINIDGGKNNTAKGLFEVELTKLQEELSHLESKAPNKAEKDILFNNKEAIEKQISDLVGTVKVDYTDVDNKQLELDVLNNKLNSKDSITRNKKRQTELKKSQKEKIKGLSDLEDKKLLLEEYLKLKNDLLSKELRNHFNKDITFKFLEFSQDGIPKDVFKMLIKGVPYSNANTAGRILAGKQIITFLQGKLGIKLPILIDNREAIVVPLDSEGLQIVECVAHKDYPKLTVE